MVAREPRRRAVMRRLCLGLALFTTLWGASARAASDGLRSYTRTLSVSGKSIRASVVEASLKSVRVKVGLAGGKVGQTEALAQLAGRSRALAAINGCFFDAYTSSPLKNPHHTLMSGGRLLHVGGAIGCALWVTGDGRAGISKLHLKLAGSLEGKRKWPYNWYAYWVNRLPENETTATIFTPDWARRTTPAGGVNVVVRRGVVKAVHRTPTEIPPDGYVVYVRGAEEGLADRFRVGTECEYRAVPREASERSLAGDVQEVMGCGPRLLADGRVVADPAAEGFSHPKIISLACARSAVGLSRDGRIFLVTTGAATIRQLAQVMQQLGCTEAMNLDGGASSGLWCKGSYLTNPGRAISNALLLLPGE